MHLLFTQNHSIEILKLVDNSTTQKLVLKKKEATIAKMSTTTIKNITKRNTNTNNNQEHIKTTSDN